MKRFTLMLVVVGVLALGAGTGATAATTQTITLQSGVGLGVGQADPNISVVSTDMNTPLWCIPSAPGPAVVVTHGAYTTLPGTNYVGVANTCSGYAGAGGSVFRLSFTLPAGATDVALNLQTRSDNGIVVKLNGTVVNDQSTATTNVCGASFYGSNSPIITTATTGFVTGTNTLDFVIDNCGQAGPNGLDLSGTVTYSVGPNLPTNKDQCKGDGWKSFGVFKNQGDCVSFVATGGRNQPAK